MAKRIDWMDYAHTLDKEREAMQDRAGAGVAVSLSVETYGFSAPEFTVGLRHPASKLFGHGRGRTPAKALDEARADLAKQIAEQQRRPRLVAAGPKALPGMEDG